MLGPNAMLRFENGAAENTQQEIWQMALAAQRLVALLLAEIAQLLQTAQYRIATGWEGTMMLPTSLVASSTKLNPEGDEAGCMQQGQVRHIDYYFNAMQSRFLSCSILS